MISGLVALLLILSFVHCMVKLSVENEKKCVFLLNYPPLSPRSLLMNQLPAPRTPPVTPGRGALGHISNTPHRGSSAGLRGVVSKWNLGISGWKSMVREIDGWADGLMRWEKLLLLF